MHLHPLVLLADFSVSEGGFSFWFELPLDFPSRDFPSRYLPVWSEGAFGFNTLSFVTRLACYITPDLRREDEDESHFLCLIKLKNK
ncbi:hypothetical protein [Hafnia paralvei]|uniref:hypothetical protein n=1 Tax=Hafnia paralvei TaxID=546367 RepID=UPI0018F08AD2|nr:hypothetical protein [Hafnia paralvei]MBW2955943.1 hypothetical protein [Hafnia paralvei]MCQ4168384.1 hypothetical protein [Hafnia paralvei]